MPYGVFSKNREKSKQVALTFDDGPHPRYTKQILSILEEFDVPATFFVVGINAYRYPDVLKEIVDAGCEIGNHTYSHCDMAHTTNSQVQDEILDCEEIIFQQTNQVPHLLRPPEGRFNTLVEEAAQTMNYQIILWSIDTKDWANTPSETIVKKVLKELDHGDIILMHDYVSGKNTTCEALRILIPQILEMGYEFVTVSELIGGDTT